jgi:DNA-directed RNA polymerase subunit RPC12/RpoP
MSEMVPYTYSFCRRCDSRVELGRIAYGAAIACPACGFQFIIHSPAQGHGGAGEGRGDGDAIAAASDDRPTLNDAAVAPLRLFFSGTFTFPLRLAVLPQTLSLCFVAAALFAAVRLGAWCAYADCEGIDKATRVLLWNGLALSITCGALATVAWIYAASACGMTILRDTACGADVVNDWPSLLALEDAGQCLYVFNGLFLAVLPGVLAGRLWNLAGIPLAWTIGIGIGLLFPLLLLSMLAATSPLHLLSSRVLKSLLREGLAWVGFYMTTLAAVLVVVALEIAVWRHKGWAINVAVAGWVAAVGWMVYFRLLGRLAWFLTFQMGGKSPSRRG